MTKSDQVSLCDCDFVPLLSFMNYCQAPFEIVTRIRQMAPLLYIINFRKLRLRVKNETTFISSKNRVDLSSISEVRNYITEWPRFLAHPVHCARLYAIKHYCTLLVADDYSWCKSILLLDLTRDFISPSYSKHGSLISLHRDGVEKNIMSSLKM